MELSIAEIADTVHGTQVLIKPLWNYQEIDISFHFCNACINQTFMELSILEV